MASGIVVRSIASLIDNKRKDPCVVVIDELGENIIPILGGHHARGNELARTLASLLHGRAIITTSSDLRSLPALDLWIERCNLTIKNKELLPKIMSRFNKKREILISITSDFIKIPLIDPYLKITNDIEKADVVITNKRIENAKDKLILIPNNLIVGMGLHDWISLEEIEEAFHQVMAESGLYFEAIKGIATVDKKANILSLREFYKKYKFKLYSFSPDELNSVKSISSSSIVLKTIGVSSVSEQASILASKGRLLVPKQVFKNLTIAIAEAPYYVKGKIYVVGTGPGSLRYLIPKAVEAIRQSDIIIGYKRYVNLIEDLIRDKEVLAYGMTEEVKRAKIAVEEALKGKFVSVVSGGDPGIYGMAGLILEIISQNNVDVDVEIIPGISAFNASASLVGAPLMNDFACVSLSDRLIPWEEIEKRLMHSAMSDFVIVLYNPKSTKRKEHLTKAKEILLKFRRDETPVAIIKNATRKDEEIILTTLKEMDNFDVDMNTTIIVGNSRTYTFKNFMITLRGYERKYEGEYELVSPSLG